MKVPSLSESICDHLRTKIIIGELHSGQKLNENKLSTFLDISRATLREVLRILEKEALVVNVPRRGSFVSKLSLSDLEEVYDARIMLEIHCIELLCDKGIKEIPEVEKALDLSNLQPVKPEDGSEQIVNYQRVCSAFHRRLVESAGNPKIENFYSSISSHLARYQFMSLHLPKKAAKSNKDHKIIYDQIHRGEYNQAISLMKAHLNQNLLFLKEKLFREMKEAS